MTVIVCQSVTTGSKIRVIRSMTPAELELQLKLLGISPDVKMVDLLDILQHKQVELNQYDKRLEHMSVTNFKKYPAAKTQLDGDDPFEGEEIRTDIDARSANEQYPRGTIRIAGESFAASAVCFLVFA